MPWHREGRPSPEVLVPSGVRLDWIRTAAEVSGVVSQYADAAEIQARLHRGDACLVWRNETDRSVLYHLWVSEVGAYIAWIDAPVFAGANELLVYDVWLDPGHRGGAVHWAAAGMACGEAIRRERTTIIGGVEHHEFAPFAVGYRRFGIGIMVAQRTLVGVRLFGWSWHFERPPPPDLKRVSPSQGAAH